MLGFDAVMSELIEIVNSNRKNDIRDAANILKNASVPFISDFEFDETFESDLTGELKRSFHFLSVRKVDYKRSWEALEASALSSPLPNEHFLHSVDEYELLGILAEPDRSGPFLTAHARSIANDRGYDVPDNLPLIEDQMVKRDREKLSSRKLLFYSFAVVMALFTIRTIARLWHDAFQSGL